MRLHRRFMLLAASVALPIAGIAALAPQASAGGAPPAAGTVSCKKVIGAITFSPGITSNGDLSVKTETVTIKTTDTDCTVAGTRAPAPTKATAVGKFVVHKAGGKANACNTIGDSYPATFHITWTDRKPVAPSDVAFSGDAVLPHVMNPPPQVHPVFRFPNTTGPPTPKATVTGSYKGLDLGAKSVTTLVTGAPLGQDMKACMTPGGLKSRNITSGSDSQA